MMSHNRRITTSTASPPGHRPTAPPPTRAGRPGPGPTTGDPRSTRRRGKPGSRSNSRGPRPSAESSRSSFPVSRRPGSANSAMRRPKTLPVLDSDVISFSVYGTRKTINTSGFQWKAQSTSFYFRFRCRSRFERIFIHQNQPVAKRFIAIRSFFYRSLCVRANTFRQQQLSEVEHTQITHSSTINKQVRPLENKKNKRKSSY